MEGRTHRAIRMVETNCTDPAQERAFTEWYVRTHPSDLLNAGLPFHARRYKNAEPEEGGAGYLAVYELPTDNFNEVNAQFAQVLNRLQAGGRMHPALRIVRRTQWRRIGPEFPAPGASASDGLWIIESDCSDQDREREFNRWYDETHVPDLLATGCFLGASRFEAQSEQASGKYLALYETNGDPADAVNRFVREHRPRLKAAGRLSDIINITWRGVYRTLITRDGKT